MLMDQRRGKSWDRRTAAGRRMVTERRRSHDRVKEAERRGITVQRRAQMDRRRGNNQRSGFWLISWMRGRG